MANLMIRTWPAQALVGAIRLYQLCLSPLLPPMCRFTPTCSAYTIEAVRRFGVMRGGVLGAWRLLRCQPFAAAGDDPVPARFTLRRAAAGHDSEPSR